MVQQILSTNTFTTAKWIVSATASNGTHTTIASALTAASSGDTIFIRPGTYTENPTLKAGVNLTAFDSDSSNNQTGVVIISGNCTLSTAGSVTIAGIQLQTNSGNLLTVSGTVASIVNLVDCSINCTNNTGISYSSSSASSAININKCTGDLGTTAIAFYSMSSTGTLNINYSNLTNSGGSTTAASNSAGLVNYLYSETANVISTSSTGRVTGQYSIVSGNGVNTTALTTAGTGSQTWILSTFQGGTAIAVTVGSGTTLTLQGGFVSSSNTTSISGGGTINYSGQNFTNGRGSVTTTTIGVAGTLIGNQNVTPSAGFLGEQIRSAIASASAVTLTSPTAANVTSISLTAGVWDVSGVVSFNGTITGTAFAASVGTTSATLGTAGDNQVNTPTPATVASDVTLTIPAYRIVLTATTTTYLVAQGTFTVGTLKAYGRISATRAG